MSRQQATAAVRRRLVEAAVGQLAEEGMRGLTHRKVETRAGLSQGLAKYHFGNLDGLIEAVLAHLVDVDLANVISVSPAEQANALRTGVVPQSMWEQARASASAIFARPDLARARFELYLYAAGKPALQELVRRARQEFIDRVAQQLPSRDPAAGARMVLALVDGMLLHQVTAPDERLERQAPAYLLVTGAAAMTYLDQPPPE